MTRARLPTPEGARWIVGGRYERGERLASGGSSSVHRAVDVTTGEVVALKSFHVHRAFDAELGPTLAEARSLADRLPDVLVPILDLGDDGGAPFVVMPLVEGETLETRAERGLTAREAALVVDELAQKLAALHAAGFTYGDLSPSNVLVRTDGSTRLLDHETLGRIGAPHAPRATEGFATPRSATRRADDDREALEALARWLRDQTTTGHATGHVATGHVTPTLSPRVLVLALVLVLLALLGLLVTARG